jgi:Flp pilus assembly protein TadG
MLLVPRQPQSTRRGAVLVLVTICLIVIMGFAAIVIDGCLLYNDRAQMQKTADAAALAAAVDLFTNFNSNGGTDPSGTAAASARTTAKALGYDGTNATVTVNIPPASGTFTGKAGYAEVIISYNQARFFSSIWGNAATSVQARTVARGTFLPGGYGLIILDPKLQAPCEIDGNLTILNAGTIQVNSVATDPNDQPLTGACYVASTATLNVGTINVVGSLNQDGKINWTPGGTGLHTGVQPLADPLINIPEPTPSGTDYGNMTVKTDTTIYPGQYKQLTITNGANVTMAPGIYYLVANGQGMKVDSNSTVTGTGVMIYNASGDHMDFKQSGVINLTAPTSGPYQGISIWQPRSYTAETHIESVSNITLSGTLYSHGGEFDIRPDGANVTHYIGNYICDQFEAGQGYSSNGKSNGTIVINPSNAAPTNRALQIVE